MIIMQDSLSKKGFNCITDYALETINSIDLGRLGYFFKNLSSDSYLKEKYRFRRLSRFQIVDNRIVKLPHNYLFQSKEYNPILGDVIREYPEIEDELIQLQDFQKIIWEFYDFCKLCSAHNEIAVHQIRTTTSAQQIGQPAPEGIHRDGVDLVGIFCVNRDRIEGGITSLYRSKNDREGDLTVVASRRRGDLAISALDSSLLFHLVKNLHLKGMGEMEKFLVIFSQWDKFKSAS